MEIWIYRVKNYYNEGFLVIFLYVISAIQYIGIHYNKGLLYVHTPCWRKFVSLHMQPTITAMVLLNGMSKYHNRETKVLDKIYMKTAMVVFNEVKNTTSHMNKVVDGCNLIKLSGFLCWVSLNVIRKRLIILSLLWGYYHSHMS